MPDEAAEQPRRDDRVVVEQDDDFALRCRDALVVGRGEAPVLGVEDRPDARVALRGLAQILRRAVARGVVDDEDLEARPGLARERLEAVLRELETAVRHDDDGDQGLRGGEPLLDRLVAVRPVVLLGNLPARGAARVVLRLGEGAVELREELLVVAAAGEIREVRVRQKLRQRRARRRACRRRGTRRT